MNENIPNSTEPAPVSKQFLAMIYDSLLLLAVLFLANVVLLIALRGNNPAPGNPLMSGYLILVSYLFFAWFWTHGGQTLGMRAWRLKLEQNDGKPLSWGKAALRFITAVPAWLLIMIGITEVSGIKLESNSWLLALQHFPDGIVLILGLVWLYLDHRPNGWRDKVTATRVVRLAKEK